MYSAPPQLCSALVSFAPEWKFSLENVAVKLVHNNLTIPLSQNRVPILDRSLRVQFIPIAMSVVPSIVELRHVTSQILVNGVGFEECASDSYGWTLWLQALSNEFPPNMIESRCSVLNVEALICVMPDWGALYPAATVRVNVLDCSRQDVQQNFAQDLKISLRPSVLRIFPTTSSFKDAVPVTVIGRGFSSDLGLKVIFNGPIDTRSTVVTVVNHTLLIAMTPNVGSMSPQHHVNISVFTDRDEELGGWIQTPSFLLTRSIRRVFPLVHSTAGGSTATVYGLGFAPGSGYTCTFVATGDSNDVMAHSLGVAVAFTVIKCKVPAWGQIFRAGRVNLKVTFPAQSVPIPADSGSVIELSFQPAVHGLFPVVIQFSQNIIALVNGTGFGASMNLTLRLKSGFDTVAASDSCTILSVTNMTCPVPPWSVLHPAQTVQVSFDVAATDLSMVYVPPNTNIRFLDGVHNLYPTSGTIRGGTLVQFVCEGLFKSRSIVVKFSDSRGNELSSIPVLALNASSFIAAAPNWLFTFPSSTSFTADVTVSLSLELCPWCNIVIACLSIVCCEQPGLIRIVQVFYDDNRNQPISNTSILKFTFVV